MVSFLQPLSKLLPIFNFKFIHLWNCLPPAKKKKKKNAGTVVSLHCHTSSFAYVAQVFTFLNVIVYIKLKIVVDIEYRTLDMIKQLKYIEAPKKN